MPGPPREEAARGLVAVPRDEPARRRAGRAEEVSRGGAAVNPGRRRPRSPRGQDPGTAEKENGRGRRTDRQTLRGLGQAGQGRRMAAESAHGPTTLRSLCSPLADRNLTKTDLMYAPATSFVGNRPVTHMGIIAKGERSCGRLNVDLLQPSAWQPQRLYQATSFSSSPRSASVRITNRTCGKPKTRSPPK
jgi:hypothetical protein